jgi:hypothetical protein
MINHTSGQELGGCIAPTFPESNLDLSDGAISNEWPQIETYVNLTEYGQGGFIKFSHNTTHLFALIGAKDKDWVAIEFEPDLDNCMADGHDTWIFYMDYDSQSVDGIDATMRGIDIPEADAQNDLLYEPTFVDDFVYIEVVRPFDTLDTTSYDVTFTNGTEITMLVASNNDHMGSRTIYYLCVFFTSHPDPYVPDIDLGVDWSEKKDLLFYGGLIFAGLFIATHITMRVILYPLTHPNSIIDSTKMTSPSLKDRWQMLRAKTEVTTENIVKMEDTDQ